MHDFNEGVTLKLGRRLTTIDRLISDAYADIWDCCCDHGLLGAQLVQRRAADTVHFVDCVPNITQDLEKKLKRYLPFQHNPDISQWQVHCADTAELILGNKGKQLVIIAGVGGELCIQLLASLLSQNQQHFELILCPVHHQFELRQFLIKHNINLISEQLICENRRYYEVLHLTTGQAKPISLVGQEMWQLDELDHQDYLAKTIQHYQKLKLNQAHPALAAYQALLTR
ncbi:tRNA (adenine(22)-N(1))-methyltransferase TrmK [Agarivorans sp. TSD2052]|uniref:tRNA (adenine(22)-N(1))-methyltransferase n=1 Tax=Agarivorans sp. TSD2052 TaxID=2937286 RepID=UPI00200C2020|nr:tRNA (adenine(22)-N(1))-methyltransferase TrmK [Agarivorans sp. TSD2052]UPW20238.1 tRNA (adenine(22)-N(1))-methyltransferase TrmK [Agarivorans sp. TSD2052]